MRSIIGAQNSMSMRLKRGAELGEYPPAYNLCCQNFKRMRNMLLFWHALYFDIPDLIDNGLEK
jgi:hypothetical protein